MRGRAPAEAFIRCADLQMVVVEGEERLVVVVDLRQVGLAKILPGSFSTCPGLG